MNFSTEVMSQEKFHERLSDIFNKNQFTVEQEEAIETLFLAIAFTTEAIADIATTVAEDRGYEHGYNRGYSEGTAVRF